MSEEGRQLRLSQLLVMLAALSLVGQLSGLYSPTGPPTPKWFPHADKVEHALGFALPVFLLLVARLRWRQERGDLVAGGSVARLRDSFAVGLVGLAAVHAVVSEVVQHFFYEHRSGDPLDAMADFAGAALGWGMARLVSSHLVKDARKVAEPDQVPS